MFCVLFDQTKQFELVLDLNPYMCRDFVMHGIALILH